MSDSDSTIDSDELENIISSRKRVNQEANTSSSGGCISKQELSRKTHTLSDSDEELGSDDLFSNSKPKTLKMTDDAKMPCKYGENCYRKNAEHLQTFSHPEKRANLTKTTDNLHTKKPKMDSDHTNLQSQLNSFGFYLTKVNGISEKYNKGISFNLQDVLSDFKGTLISSVQFSYMFDIPWLIDQYPKEYRNCPLLIVHGEKGKSKQLLEESAKLFKNLNFCQAKLDIPYGTHHTKMIFLLYKEGLRIVIHTSNLVEKDWHQKTQGMWLSPLFPKLKNGPSLSEGESPTDFKKDLVEYLSSYRAESIEEWCTILKAHDVSKARVYIIGSIPGRHSPNASFGHLKLRKVLMKNLTSTVTPEWNIIGQFSSIGSLGTSPDAWLRGEWLVSMIAAKEFNQSLSKPSLKLIFPSVENVRKSLEGYPAGASLPYSKTTAAKQPYLKKFLHQWKSDRLGRSEASPHVKTYLRLSPDNKKIAWFLLTSANLSKAAWGELLKNKTQFFIRSYELGVLFLPQNFDQLVFGTPGTDSDDILFPIPFDIPLSPYKEEDDPWLWDVPHVALPDRNGNMWCPS